VRNNPPPMMAIAAPTTTNPVRTGPRKVDLPIDLRADGTPRVGGVTP